MHKTILGHILGTRIRVIHQKFGLLPLKNNLKPKETSASNSLPTCIRKRLSFHAEKLNISSHANDLSILGKERTSLHVNNFKTFVESVRSFESNQIKVRKKTREVRNVKIRL